MKTLKTYNSFIKKINEDFKKAPEISDDDFDDYKKYLGGSIDSVNILDNIEDDSDTTIEALADYLGVKAVDNTLVYNGKKVTYLPSEQKFLIDNKEYTDMEEVINHLM